MTRAEPETRAIALPVGLGATDRLTLAYLAALAVVAALAHPHPLPLLAAIAVLAAAIVGVARLQSVSPRGRVLHDFFPIAAVISVFSVSGPVIAEANPMRWDARLAALDRAWFGELPAAWMNLWGRPHWLTDAASLLYASYYAIPVAIAVALYRAGRRAEFERFVFTVVATFLVSYVGYFLAPALGPRVPIARESALGGGAISSGLRAFLHAVEWNELDAFPSGHTALSLVYLVLGWRLLPRWRVPLALLVVGIIFSTVYLSLHYVVDLVAGALLAAAMPLILPALRRVFAPRGREADPQRH